MHTPEPWYVHNQSIYGNEENGYICTWSGRSADAQRIVDCVNACKGINPVAVPDLLEACKGALSVITDILKRDNLPIEEYEALVNEGIRLKQAIAKAREAQQ